MSLYTVLSPSHCHCIQYLHYVIVYSIKSLTLSLYTISSSLHHDSVYISIQCQAPYTKVCPEGDTGLLFPPQKLAQLGPGQYDLKSSLDEWSGEHKQRKGKFGTVAQYPCPPTERIYNSCLAQCPREQVSLHPLPPSPKPFGCWRCGANGTVSISAAEHFRCWQHTIRWHNLNCSPFT